MLEVILMEAVWIWDMVSIFEWGDWVHYWRKYQDGDDVEKSWRPKVIVHVIKEDFLMWETIYVE